MHRRMAVPVAAPAAAFWACVGRLLQSYVIFV